MNGIDPKHVTIQTAGNVYYSSRTRPSFALPPTPEQLARRERDAWNTAVDARKAAKRAAKVSESSPVGADKEPT